MIGVMLVQTGCPKLGRIFGTNLKPKKPNVKRAAKFLNVEMAPIVSTIIWIQNTLFIIDLQKKIIVKWK